jgi:hypothetical protein
MMSRPRREVVSSFRWLATVSTGCPHSEGRVGKHVDHYVGNVAQHRGHDHPADQIRVEGSEQKTAGESAYSG